MSSILKALAVAALFVAGASAINVYAQQPQEVPAAPVPVQIAAAKKVFIFNAGQESSFRAAHDQWYSGGPNRTYNQFYAAMKDWGRYELVSAPADADLVFEIGFNTRSENVMDTWQIKLLVVDLKTGIPLWTLTKYPEPAGMAKNRERNYNVAMTALMDDLKILVASPLAGSNSQK